MADYNFDLPSDEEVTPTRSLPRAAIDTALTLGEFIPQGAKAITTAARWAFPDPHGLAAQADKIAGDVLHEYQGAKSPRAQQLGRESYMPGPDELSAYGDLPAKITETVASVLPFVFGGWAAKSANTGLRMFGKVMEKAGPGLMGAQSFGEYGQSVRHYFDNASADELRKDKVIGPQYEAALRSSNGDDAVAREELFNKAWDNGAAIANLITGTAGGMALGQKLGIKNIQKTLPRVAASTLEGGAVGAAMGGAGAYGQERQDIGLGRKTAIDFGTMERGVVGGAIPMAAMVGATGFLKPNPRKAEVVKDGKPADLELAINDDLQSGVERREVPPGSTGPPQGEFPLQPPYSAQGRLGLEGGAPGARRPFTGYQPPELPEPPPTRQPQPELFGVGGGLGEYDRTRPGGVPAGSEQRELLLQPPYSLQGGLNLRGGAPGARRPFTGYQPPELPEPPPVRQPHPELFGIGGDLGARDRGHRVVDRTIEPNAVEPRGDLLAEYAATLPPEVFPYDPMQGPHVPGPPPALPKTRGEPQTRAERPLPPQFPEIEVPRMPGAGDFPADEGGPSPFGEWPPRPGGPPGGPPPGGGGGGPPSGGGPRGGGGPYRRMSNVEYERARRALETNPPPGAIGPAVIQGVDNQGLLHIAWPAVDGTHAVAVTPEGHVVEGSLGPVRAERARQYRRDPVTGETQELPRAGRIRVAGVPGMERLARTEAAGRERRAAAARGEPGHEQARQVRTEQQAATVDQPKRTHPGLGAEIIRGLHETGHIRDIGDINVPLIGTHIHMGKPETIAMVYDSRKKTPQEYTTERRERGYLHREEVLADTFDSMTSHLSDEELTQVSKDLGDAVRTQFLGGSRPQEARQLNRNKRQGKVEVKRDRLYPNVEQIIAIARRLSPILNKAIRDVENRFSELGQHDIYRMPTEKQTRTSGKEELPEYARLGRMLYHQSRIRDLLAKIDQSERARPMTEEEAASLRSRGMSQDNIDRLQRRRARQSNMGDTVFKLRQRLQALARDWGVDARSIAEERRSTSGVMTEQKREEHPRTEAEKEKLEGQMSERAKQAEATLTEEEKQQQALSERLAALEAVEQESQARSGVQEAAPWAVGASGETLAARFESARQRHERLIDQVVDFLRENNITSRSDLLRQGVGPVMIKAVERERRLRRELTEIEDAYREATRPTDTGSTRLVGQEREVTGKPPRVVMPGHLRQTVYANRMRDRYQRMDRLGRLLSDRLRQVFDPMSVLRLRHIDAIGKDESNRLYREHAPHIEWRAAVQQHLSRELGTILRSMANQLPNYRMHLVGHANRLEANIGAGWHDATQSIVKLVGKEQIYDRLSEDLQRRIADWVLKRSIAEGHLDAHELLRREGPAVEARAAPPLRSELQPGDIREIKDRVVPGRPAEAPLEQGLVQRITNFILGTPEQVHPTAAAEMQLPPGVAVTELPLQPGVGVRSLVRPEDQSKYVKSRTVGEIIDNYRSDIGSQHDPFDSHLISVADRAVPHVVVHDVHPTIMNELMDRVGGMPDARGYYDWKTDQIYIRDDPSIGPNDRKSILREELGHAITMGALERELGPWKPGTVGEGIFARRMDPEFDAAVKRAREGTALHQLNRIAGHLLDVVARGRRVRGEEHPLGAHEARLRNGHELVAGIWADEQFRRVLAGQRLSARDREQLGLPPRNGNVLAAITETILNAVRRLFGRYSDDHVLNDVLALSMDVMGRAIRERPAYVEGYGRRGAESIGDWITETKGKAGKALQYKLKHGMRDLMQSKLLHHLMTTARLPSLVSADVRHHYYDLLNVFERGSNLVNTIVTNMGTYAKGREIKDFERLYGDKAREAFHFLNDVTKHEANPEVGLDHPRNAHIRSDDPTRLQTIEQHPEMMERYKKLAEQMPGDAEKKVPGFADFYKSQLDFHRANRLENLKAQVFNAVDRADMVLNPDGTRNSTARNALTKLVMDDAKSLTGPEKAWADSIDKVKLKDEVALFRREIPDFRMLKGPYFPLKRFGGHGVYGEFNLLPTSKGVVDADDPGLFRFKSEADRADYVRRHTKEGPGTKLLSAYDRVIESNTGKITNVPVRLYNREPGEHPGMEVAHFARFQKKYFATRESAREAQEHIDELRNDPHLTMRPDPFHVRDFATLKNPEYIDKSFEASINRFKRSEAYAKMSDTQRREVLAEMHDNAAKQVQLAGGRTPGLTRQYVKGASTDYFQNFMTSTHQSAYARARAEMGDRFRDAVQTIEKENKERRWDKNSGVREDVLNTMLMRYYDQHDPMAHTWLDKNMTRLTNIAYQADLFGPGFLIVNGMELTIQALPALAAKIGWSAALKQYKNAYATGRLGGFVKRGFSDMWSAARGKFDKIDDYQHTIHGMLDAYHGTEKDGPQAKLEKQMFAELARDSHFDPETINQVSLLQIADANKLDKTIDYGKRVFQGPNNAVEVMNRMNIALMFYRGMQEKHPNLSHDQLVREAKDAINKYAGNYNQWNRAPITNTRGLLMPMMQYKQFAVRVLENWTHNAVASFSRIDKELLKPGREADLKAVMDERSERRRQFTNMLMMQSMVAGVFGLPTEIFSIPANALYASGATNQNWDDMLDTMYKAGAEEFGPEVMKGVAHGVLSYTGANIYDRQSLSNLIFFGGPASAKPSDIEAGIGSFVLGSGGQHLLKFGHGLGEIGEALSDFSAGANDRGSMKMVQAVRDIMPIRWGADISNAILNSSKETAPRSAGGALLGPEFNTWQTFLQSMGIQGTDISRGREMARAEKRFEKREDTERQMWLQRYAMADLGARPQIEAGIRDYNDGIAPERRIKRPEMIAAAARRREQTKRPGTEMALATSRRTKPTEAYYRQVYDIGG